MKFSIYRSIKSYIDQYCIDIVFFYKIKLQFFEMILNCLVKSSFVLLNKNIY